MSEELRPLTDTEIDAVTGGQCKIGLPGQKALANQLVFLTGDSPFPPDELPSGLRTAAVKTGGCLIPT